MFLAVFLHLDPFGALLEADNDNPRYDHTNPSNKKKPKELPTETPKERARASYGGSQGLLNAMSGTGTSNSQPESSSPPTTGSPDNDNKLIGKKLFQAATDIKTKPPPAPEPKSDNGSQKKSSVPRSPRSQEDAPESPTKKKKKEQAHTATPPASKRKEGPSTPEGAFMADNTVVDMATGKKMTEKMKKTRKDYIKYTKQILKEKGLVLGGDPPTKGVGKPQKYYFSKAIDFLDECGGQGYEQLKAQYDESKTKPNALSSGDSQKLKRLIKQRYRGGEALRNMLCSDAHMFLVDDDGEMVERSDPKLLALIPPPLPSLEEGTKKKDDETGSTSKDGSVSSSAASTPLLQEDPPSCHVSESEEGDSSQLEVDAAIPIRRRELECRWKDDDFNNAVEAMKACRDVLKTASTGSNPENPMVGLLADAVTSKRTIEDMINDYRKQTMRECKVPKLEQIKCAVLLRGMVREHLRRNPGSSNPRKEGTQDKAVVDSWCREIFQGSGLPVQLQVARLSSKIAEYSCNVFPEGLVLKKEQVREVMLREANSENAEIVLPFVSEDLVEALGKAVAEIQQLNPQTYVPQWRNLLVGALELYCRCNAAAKRLADPSRQEEKDLESQRDMLKRIWEKANFLIKNNKEAKDRERHEEEMQRLLQQVLLQTEGLLFPEEHLEMAVGDPRGRIAIYAVRLVRLALHPLAPKNDSTNGTPTQDRTPRSKGGGKPASSSGGKGTKPNTSASKGAKRKARGSSQDGSSKKKAKTPGGTQTSLSKYYPATARGDDSSSTSSKESASFFGKKTQEMAQGRVPSAEKKKSMKKQQQKQQQQQQKKRQQQDGELWKFVRETRRAGYTGFGSTQGLNNTRRRTDTDDDKSGETVSSTSPTRSRPR